jgi:hypothetical protein
MLAMTHPAGSLQISTLFKRKNRSISFRRCEKNIGYEDKFFVTIWMLPYTKMNHSSFPTYISSNDTCHTFPISDIHANIHDVLINNIFLMPSFDKVGRGGVGGFKFQTEGRMSLSTRLRTWTWNVQCRNTRVLPYSDSFQVYLNCSLD